MVGRRVPLPALLLSALALLAAACADQPAARPERPDTTVAATPDEGADRPPPAHAAAWIDSLRADERPRIDALAPAVVRPSWDRLAFRAADGTRRVLQDRLAGEDIMQLHVLRGNVEPLGAWLVEQRLFEGGRWLLVSHATGDTITLDGPPVVSPDRARFVTTSADLVAGHDPNRLRVYRVGPPIELEWQLEPRDWAADSARWIDAATIEVDSVTVDYATTPLTFPRSPKTLSRTANGWNP